MEKDEIRRHDSFQAFEEICSIAEQKQVDFILLGGDLFHENKPSRSTLVKAIEILRRHCLNDRPIQFQVVSDQTVNFANSFGHVNYEDPHFNVGLPVFSIHGNHDDPAGVDNLSAVDILSACNLVNYFGKMVLEGSGVGQITLYPILIKKGSTSVALYGLGNIRDERLNRMFQTPHAVQWMRPEAQESCQVSDWFNILVLHQNRVKTNPKNAINEHFLPRFLDFIIWGHEHECLVDPKEVPGMGFHITQPGSSVATSLIDGESKPKHVLLLEIKGNQYRPTKIPLNSVRPFEYTEVVLKDEPDIDPNDQNSILEHLDKVVANPQDILIFSKSSRKGRSEDKINDSERLRPEELNQQNIEALVAESNLERVKERALKAKDGEDFTFSGQSSANVEVLEELELLLPSVMMRSNYILWLKVYQKGRKELSQSLRSSHDISDAGKTTGRGRGRGRGKRERQGFQYIEADHTGCKHGFPSFTKVCLIVLVPEAAFPSHAYLAIVLTKSAFAASASVRSMADEEDEVDSDSNDETAKLDVNDIADSSDDAETLQGKGRKRAAPRGRARGSTTSKRGRKSDNPSSSLHRLLASRDDDDEDDDMGKKPNKSQPREYPTATASPNPERNQTVRLRPSYAHLRLEESIGPPPPPVPPPRLFHYVPDSVSRPSPSSSRPASSLPALPSNSPTVSFIFPTFEVFIYFMIFVLNLISVKLLLSLPTTACTIDRDKPELSVEEIMPKVKTNRVKYPEGWELIEPTLRELQAKMREAENDPHDGKRKCEGLWPIFKIAHQKSRYIFDLYHRRNEISKELYEFCLDQGYADRNLIAKWKKPGYERLCCLRCMQPRDHNFQTTCICRVPQHLREEKAIECVHCGCRGCASGD
ncbi:UNVERIFIED_CONTAM: Double-strand break repair protein MRE11 [Sesamum calycinum]|uniref:Double-strand break repair protein MRE11 n=1 Tax=Sesamum calycinum TaxID=2727403 RepID=A0AAW2NWB6_9LAMI